MKLPKVKKEDLEAAYLKEDSFQVQLDSKSPLVEETFFGLSFARELKKAKKCGDIWEGIVNINGKGKKSFSIWLNADSYMKGYTVERTLAESETEKILFQNKSYRISLIREDVALPTDTYWGTKMLDPKYALFDSKDKLVYKDRKKWRFTEVLLNGYADKEQVIKSFIDEIKIEVNPFKAIIVNMTDTKKMDELREKLDFTGCDSPDREDYYYDKFKDKNYWAVYLVGLNEFADRIRKRNATWFIVNSKKKPSVEECFIQLRQLFEQYSEKERFIDYLNYIKEEYQMDLNKVDFDLEERVHSVFNNKFYAHFCRVFGIKDKDLVMQYVKDDWEYNH